MKKSIGTTVAAWGVSCEFDDRTDRPLLGTMAIDLSKLEGKSVDDSISTITHEMAHIFGFSKYDFQFWRDENGTKHKNVTIERTIRGSNRLLLATPNVIKHARKFFN
jgi:hypothetical protein